MQTYLGGLLIMNVKNIEKNGNQATVVVELDKELMEECFPNRDFHDLYVGHIIKVLTK